MKNFILIGAAGYIAPRHLKAIRTVNGRLVACSDINDSSMIVNEYFKDCKIFTNFTQFEKFVSGFISKGNKIDYVVICSPNFLHYEHISWALMQGINVICEKPLVLQSKDLNKLVNLEKNNHAKVFSILQLRYHEEILKLKEKFKDLDGKRYK